MVLLVDESVLMICLTTGSIVVRVVLLTWKSLVISAAFCSTIDTIASLSRMSQLSLRSGFQSGREDKYFSRTGCLSTYMVMVVEDFEFIEKRVINHLSLFWILRVLIDFFGGEF